MIDELINKILEEPITVVSSAILNGRMQLVYKIIVKAGIESNKTLHIFNYDGPNSWMTKNLISVISGIDKRKVSAYYEPCENAGKSYGDNIDEPKFMNAIQKLQKSNIWMTDFAYQEIAGDYLDYLLTYHKEMGKKASNIYIINTFDVLLKKTHYEKENVLAKIRSFVKDNNTHIILITKAKYEDKNKLKLTNIIDYKLLAKYVKLFILLNINNNQLDILLKDDNTSRSYCWLINKENNRISEAFDESKNIKRN